MKQELKQQYVSRITQANRTELLVIVYELLQQDLRQAMEEYEREELEAFQHSLQHAQRFLVELMETLDFKYELSFELLSLYKFVNKVILDNLRKKEADGLKECIGIIEKIKHSYEQLVPLDHSGPVMVNTQKVYAGLTYGRHSLSEISVDSTNGHRGLYA